jgi:hypothetical protein
MEARVYSVEDVHIEALMVIGASPPAIAVSARGVVNSTGWTNPQLAPWIYIDTPKDGILDLDFIATAPTGFVNFVMCRIAVGLAFTVPRWVRGVRLHSATNTVEALLDKPLEKGEAVSLGEGMPVPWPFPWQAPSAMT